MQPHPEYDRKSLPPQRSSSWRTRTRPAFQLRADRTDPPAPPASLRGRSPCSSWKGTQPGRGCASVRAHSNPIVRRRGSKPLPVRTRGDGPGKSRGRCRHSQAPYEGGVRFLAPALFRNQRWAPFSISPDRSWRRNLPFSTGTWFPFGRWASAQAQPREQPVRSPAPAGRWPSR